MVLTGFYQPVKTGLVFTTLTLTIMDHFLMHFIFMIELNTFRAEKLKIRNNGLTYLTVSVTAGSGSLSPSF